MDHPLYNRTIKPKNLLQTQTDVIIQCQDNMPKHTTNIHTLILYNVFFIQYDLNNTCLYRRTKRLY